MSPAGFHQEGRPAFPPASKMKIDAGNNMAGCKGADKNVIDESLGAKLGEVLRKWLLDNSVYAERAGDRSLERGRRQTRQPQIRLKEPAGVRLEGEHQRRGADGPRLRKRPAQDCLVAAMNPVEIADRNNASPEVGIQSAGALDPPHPACTADGRIHCSLVIVATGL
jgi:hypothetical protein